MNVWIRLAAVSICTFAAGCGGGGGGGNRGGNATPTGMQPVPPIPGGGVPMAPQSVVDVQGLYFGSTPDPDDPNTTLFAQVLITADGRVLFYVDEVDSTSIGTVVIDGRLVASGSDAALTDATAFLTGEPPTAAAGTFQIDTDPNTDADLNAQLTVNGNTISFPLESLPAQYMKPSSLQAIAGTYGDGFDTDSTVMIDSAGNVIVTQDADTGCGGTGRVTVDMPTVNAYALSLQLTGCADPARNGTYRGRLSLGDLQDGGLLVLSFAHSDTMPLFDQQFEKI